MAGTVTCMIQVIIPDTAIADDYWIGPFRSEAVADEWAGLFNRRAAELTAAAGFDPEQSQPHATVHRLTAVPATILAERLSPRTPEQS